MNKHRKSYREVNDSILIAEEITQMCMMSIGDFKGEERLIEHYINFNQQLQPAGFDVTLAKILTVDDIYPVKLGDAKDMFKNHMKETQFNEVLQPLRPYVFITNEFFNMPNWITGMCFNRSSITRLGGVLGSAIIDAGYKGHLSFSFFGTLPILFNRDDRISQIVFLKHKPTFDYHGQYQSGK